MTIEQQMKIIRRGVEEIIPEEDLIKKLKRSEKTGKPLRIKYGIDPTGYDVHIGHLVPIRKMREFEDLGHTGVIIIGDYTAQIGDPTGRDESRPPLTAEQVRANAERYMEQLYKVLDPEKTEVRFQSEWFGPMGMADVLKLMGQFTLAQFMAHDTFRKRYEAGLPLGMHEIMYPILQGYDSVAVQSDVELGATEQKFNILTGRDMQRIFNQEEQIAMLSPILMGTDGKEKMSKSLNNYIAVFDTPQDKFGKVMSIPDSAIINYYNYTSSFAPNEIEEIKKKIEAGENPYFYKIQLAHDIVKMLDKEPAATNAEEEFKRIFSQREIPTDIPELIVCAPRIMLVDLLAVSGLCATKSEARRMIEQNAVSIDGEKNNDVYSMIEITKEFIIKVGKRRFMRIIKG